MFFKASKFFLFATALAVAIVTTSTLFPFIVGKYVFVRTAIDLALIFFLLGLVFDPAGAYFKDRFIKLFRSPMVWAVSAFTAAFLAACFFGINPSFSFWSNFERGEGGFQILSLYVFFLLLATLFERKKDWKIMFSISVIGALLMVGYGVGSAAKYVGATTQMVNGQPTLVPQGSWGSTFGGFIGGTLNDRFSGSIGNPSYVAVYLMFSLFYALYLFFDKYGNWKTWRSVVLGLAMAVFLVFFYLTATRGAFVGILAAAGVFAVALAYSRPKFRKWVAGGLFVLALAVAVLVGFHNSPALQNLPASRIFDLSPVARLFQTNSDCDASVSSSADTFKTRRIMWGIALKGLQDKPLLGFGPENFIYVFDRSFETCYFNPANGFGAWFDRANSIVFDSLAETGTLGLLGYLSIFGVMIYLFFGSIRKPEKYSGFPVGKESIVVKSLGLALPIGYLIQGLILFDVLPTYLSIFLVAAFVVYEFSPESNSTTAPGRPAENPTGLYAVVVAGIFLAITAMVMGSFMPLIKSQRYIDAVQSVNSVRSVQEFETLFNNAINFYSPIGDEEIGKFLGGDIANAISYAGQPENVSRALEAYVEPQLMQDNVVHLMILGNLRTILWKKFNKPEDYNKAEEFYLKAHEIGPKLPTPMYALMELYRLKNEKEKMTAIGRQILSYWPNDIQTRNLLSGTK